MSDARVMDTWVRLRSKTKIRPYSYGYNHLPPSCTPGNDAFELVLALQMEF